MASTFGGLNTAYTGLVAAKTAIEVAGQNIANVKTDGYTRQRVTLQSVAPVARAGLFSTPIASAGGGVNVTGIARLADGFLDARVRASASSAGFSYVRATTLTSLEKSLNEPGDKGISASLQGFWASWQSLSNDAGNEAPSSVLLADAGVLTTKIAAGYTAASDLWSATRTNADSLVDGLNTAASQVAQLNGMIRSTLQAGGSVNELLDQRATLTATIASLAGGTVNERADGTVDVLIGGNPIVTGTTANVIAVAGPRTMDAGPVQLEWAKRPGSPVALDGGELAGTLSMLAQSNATGTGGALAEAAASYNTLATTLATAVNTAHAAGVTSSGATGLAFFAVAATGPAALGLTVVPTKASEIATGAAGQGSLDGSVADAISLIGKAAGSPDKLWSTFVTKTAVATKSELQQSVLADLAANNALASQMSVTSVDLDEENQNLVMSQTAYQGAARVFTAIDEMLDTLINRTGLVGR